jgi:hypothetical protein
MVYTTLGPIYGETGDCLLLFYQHSSSLNRHENQHEMPVPDPTGRL